MIQILLSLIPTILLIVLIWYIVKFIFNKTGLFKKKNHYKTLSITITTLIIYILTIKLIFSSLSNIPKEKFDEIKWKSSVNERYKMIDDLIESKYIIGKNKEEIIGVFDSPKEKIIEEEENVWIYELIGRSWADFRITTLKIHFKDSIVYRVSH